MDESRNCVKAFWPSVPSGLHPVAPKTLSKKDMLTRSFYGGGTIGGYSYE